MSLARRGFVCAALCVAAAIATGSGCRLRSRGTPAAEAALAPELALADQDGVTHRLAELRASGPVVLVFYRGHW